MFRVPMYIGLAIVFGYLLALATFLPIPKLIAIKTISDEQAGHPTWPGSSRGAGYSDQHVR